MTVSAAHDLITVLEVTTPPDGTTRYIDQVIADADPLTHFTYFSWKRAFLGGYDVLHVHWPENLLRAHTGIKRILLPLLLRALIMILRVRRVPILRTLHNLDPHEGGSRFEQSALRALDRATDTFVTINPVTRAPHGAEVAIPHGHYRDRFDKHPKSTLVPGTLIYAGLIRPYKGVERLIEAFESLPKGLVEHLRIVGRPTPELRKLIESACARNPRITARLEFVPDSVLVEELTSAELVCLPYEDLHNSGMALVGLSLDRPLIVPETVTTRSLSNEVGRGWMHFFRGPFDAAQLERAIRANRESAEQREKRPLLEDRDWHLVAARYNQAFRDAIARARN